jgi:3-deoxy-D-manno-octulosonate 8-phosphate phosphatase (KDO 8-P phosphatase)
VSITRNRDDAVERAKKVRLVIFDVHGVLTDNTVLYNDAGQRMRAFCHEDGFGSNALMFCGVEVAIITRKSNTVAARMADIGVKRYYETKEKIAQYEKLLEELNLTDEQVCYVGDEVIDLGVMRRVGFAVAPSDAKRQALEAAHWVTEKAGGKGVARELAEMILVAQDKWDNFCEKVASKGW